ncbi:MAG: glycosyltransferase family 2 protein [Verrucomicrobium sp.]|nr:glycosyltransferase family 2 protein [Verrucomicrobium sp.]
MKISLVLTTYEQPVSLAKCLDSIAAQTRLADEVAVADDGSGEETARVIASFSAKYPFPVHHVRQERDGYRKTRIFNQALARTRGEYVIFLDGDSVPHHRFVEDHEALAEPGVWVQGRRAFVKEEYVPRFTPDFGCVLAYALSGKMTGLAKAFRLPFPRVRRNRELRGILGCNLGIWRADLDVVNGYDETYTGFGREDSDLGARLFHLGRDRKNVHGRAILYHMNHPIYSREGTPANDARLAETLRTGRIACERGLRDWL